MDRINSIDPYVKATISEQPARLSPSSQSSPARTAAIITLIQKTRTLSSLPLSEDDELKLAVITWTEALCDIPDQWLAPSWRKATQDHDWSKWFPVLSVIPAYQTLIAEHLAKEKQTSYRTNGTTACRWCGDRGYIPIETYCPTGKEWHIPVYACECPAIPINQRQVVVIPANWQRNERGYWQPKDEASAPPCSCGFCRARKYRK